MKQEFSDRASFLKASLVLKEATFLGHELTFDEASRTMRLSVTRAEPGQGGGFLGRRRTAWLRTVLTVRRVSRCRLSLAKETGDVYVLDRCEVDRGGQEIAIYFRPGDRAVLDVDQIEGSVEDAGRATAAPRKPIIRNPLVDEEMAEKQRAGRPGKRR